jgi:hypothetical protein
MKGKVMRKLIKFSLREDDHIWVEVDEPESLSEVEGERARGSTEKFEKILEKLQPVVSTIIEKLRNLTCSPDNVEVTFGLKLSTNAGLIIAAAETEANFTLKLTWESGPEKQIYKSRG